MDQPWLLLKRNEQMTVTVTVNNPTSNLFFFKPGNRSLSQINSSVNEIL